MAALASWATDGSSLNGEPGSMPAPRKFLHAPAVRKSSGGSRKTATQCALQHAVARLPSTARDVHRPFSRRPSSMFNGRIAPVPANPATRLSTRCQAPVPASVNAQSRRARGNRRPTTAHGRAAPRQYRHCALHAEAACGQTHHAMPGSRRVHRVRPQSRVEGQCKLHRDMDKPASSGGPACARIVLYAVIFLPYCSLALWV